MRITALKATVLALAAVTMLAAFSGCGLEQPSDVTGGKDLFVQKCGSCHGLKAAGTSGNVGPNLDYSFGAAVKSGESRKTVKGVVLKQIQFPMGSEMPANLVKGKDADAVAEYVSQVAGR